MCLHSQRSRHACPSRMSSCRCRCHMSMWRILPASSVEHFNCFCCYSKVDRQPNSQLCIDSEGPTHLMIDPTPWNSLSPLVAATLQCLLGCTLRFALPAVRSPQLDDLRDSLHAVQEGHACFDHRRVPFWAVVGSVPRASSTFGFQNTSLSCAARFEGSCLRLVAPSATKCCARDSLQRLTTHLVHHSSWCLLSRHSHVGNLLLRAIQHNKSKTHQANLFDMA